MCKTSLTKMAVLVILAWSTLPIAVEAETRVGPSEAFDEQVRDALLRNPEIVLEVFAILERQNDERQAQKDAAVLDAVSEMLFGDVDQELGQGTPVMIEFVDYNCSYCRRAEEEVLAVLEANETVVLKVLQLPILGDSSVEAARLAYAAKLIYGEEKYLEINRALLEGGALAMQNLDGFLAAMGFDPDALREAADDPQIDDHLTTTRELARRLNITGTPGFITRTRIHRGFVAADELTESALKTATADGKNQ